MAKTIAVDFDGVIHAYRKGWHDGTIYDLPLPGAIDGLLRLIDEYSVFVFTTRECNRVGTWLLRAGLPITVKPDGDPNFPFWTGRETILVTNLKYAAVAYIDDRAYKFTDWDQTTLDW